MKSGSQQRESGRSMLTALSAVRSDAMRRLTTEDAERDVDEPIASSVDTSGVYARVVRKVCPQKQALNTDETKVLIDHDQLTANKSTTDSTTST